MRSKRIGWMFAALAAMGLLLLATACGDDVGGGGDDDNDSSGGLVVKDGATAASGKEAPSLSGGGGAPAAGGPAPDLASVVDRKIIYNANLELQAEDVQFTFASVQRLAREAGGFVDQSSFNFREAQDGQQRAFATLRLRVPGHQYLETLASLRALDGVKVSNEGSGSREVTEEYTDHQSRLRNLERTEAQYLELLKQATTIDQILTVNDRINGVRAQIEQVVGRLQLLDELTDFATIDISLVPFIPAKASTDVGKLGIGEVFVDAWEASPEVVRVLGYVAAVAAVAAIWLFVPGLLVAGGLYLHRRAVLRP